VRINQTPPGQYQYVVDLYDPNNTKLRSQFVITGTTNQPETTFAGTYFKNAGKYRVEARFVQLDKTCANSPAYVNVYSPSQYPNQ
jgi:hypothetical protein